MNKLILFVFSVFVKVVWAGDLGEPCTTSATTTVESPTIDNNAECLIKKLDTKLLPKAPHCGAEDIARTIGDREATIYEYNWLVLLEYKKPGNRSKGFHCGGSLINDRYVLTAANCLKNMNSSWELFSVRVGEHDLDSDKDCDIVETCLPPVQDIEIEEQIVHPDYRKENRDNLHDIALLRLKKKVAFGDFVGPICLPSAQHLWKKDYTGDYLTVAGWGETEDNEKSSIKLHVNVPFVQLEKCRAVYEGRSTFIDQQMYAGGEKEKGSCNGDEGGPLMAKDLDDPYGPYYIAGITSYGVVGKCGVEGYPVVYTRVADYLEWIVDNIKP